MASWRSTVAMVAAVTISTVRLIAGAGSTLEAAAALVTALGGGKYVAQTRRLAIRGGNGGASLPSCSGA